MRSIEARFKQIETRNQNWSSYIVFAHAVREQDFCRDRLVRHFNKLVEVEDYDKADKKAIIRFLLSLSKKPRSTELGVKMAGNERKQRY